MGAYLYKVSTTPCGTLNGEPVYPATYAYKPWWGFDAETLNQKLGFRTGVLSCYRAWERKADRENGGRFPDVLVAHLGDDGVGNVYRIRHCSGAVVDDDTNGFDQPPVAKDWRAARLPRRYTQPA